MLNSLVVIVVVVINFICVSIRNCLSSLLQCQVLHERFAWTFAFYLNKCLSMASLSAYTYVCAPCGFDCKVGCTTAAHGVQHFVSCNILFYCHFFHTIISYGIFVGVRFYCVGKRFLLLYLKSHCCRCLLVGKHYFQWNVYMRCK